MNFFSRFFIFVAASLTFAGSVLADSNPYWRLTIPNYGLASIPYEQVPSRCVWKTLAKEDRSAASIVCSFNESDSSTYPYEEPLIRKVKKTLSAHCWWGADGWNSRVDAEEAIKVGNSVDAALFTSVLGCRFVINKNSVSSAHVCVLNNNTQTCSSISTN